MIVNILTPRSFIKTDSNFGFANVDFDLTNNLITKDVLQEQRNILLFRVSLQAIKRMKQPPWEEEDLIILLQ